MAQFAREVLPTVPIDVRFVLVTGDSTHTMPDGIPTKDGLRDYVLSHPSISTWFARNLGPLSRNYPHMHPLPLGNDFHTQYLRPGTFSLDRMHPSEQNGYIYRLADTIPLHHRLTSVHVSFHLTPSDENFPWGGPNSTCSRAHVADVLRKTLPRENVAFLEGKMDRQQSWREQVPFAFVASAYGRGLDCHRTGEALQLGHVVLMQRTNHAEFWHMFDGLPVILLDSWDEVTVDSLRRWHLQWAKIMRQPDRIKEIRHRLSLAYWWDKVRGAAKKIAATSV